MKRLIALATVGAALAAALPSAALGQGNTAKPISRAQLVKSLDTRFSGIDSNHDGKVTKGELATAQQRELQAGIQKIRQQMQIKFRQLDTNKDGQLSQAEFMVVVPTLRANETPDQLLAKLDANKNGSVTNDEFRAPDLAKFNRIDANRDGIATLEEMRRAAGRK